MDATTFQQQAQQDPDLNEFVQEVALSLPIDENEPPQRMILGVDVATLTLVYYVLYRYVKNLLDQQRTLQGIEAAGAQIEVIKALTDQGIPLDKAETTVAAIIAAIDKRDKGDPIFDKIKNMFWK